VLETLRFRPKSSELRDTGWSYGQRSIGLIATVQSKNLFCGRMDC
jgi:hypothetical protein